MSLTRPADAVEAETDDRISSFSQFISLTSLEHNSYTNMTTCIFI